MTSLDDIRLAADRIRDTVVRTPLVDVSEVAGRRLWLKPESLQITGSFKLRGAFNLLSHVVAEGPCAGVITYSSGNHAQAVAFAARAVGVPAVVVMPTTAPDIKVSGTRRFGAEVLFEGTTSLERKARAEREAESRGLMMIPPFDHPRIVEGQGTVGLEILEDLPTVERVYVPIGGGGLISGVSAAMKSTSLDIHVVGVEPSGAAKMRASLEAGRPVTLDRVASVADGLLPVRPGDLTFEHTRAFVDEVVTVDDTEIERAVAWLIRRAKLVAEPSGAAALAACLARHVDDSSIEVAVVSGGNINPDRLVDVMNRYG